MTEFRPYGLFYDALSAEFYPRPDKSAGKQTIARLAAMACEEGEYIETEDGMVHSPSWARNSQVIVIQPKDEQPFRSQVMIGDMYGRWPRQIRFTNSLSNPAMGPRKNNLVIANEHHLEIVHPLELGDALTEARASVKAIARDYYNRLKDE